MPPTSEAIDLTELAELLEDEDSEADESQAQSAPTLAPAGEIAVA